LVCQANRVRRDDERSGCGQLLIALDINAFQPFDAFGARMEELIQEIKLAPLAKGFEEIYYPGELEARNEQENRKRGLLLPDDTLADLRAIAQSTGLQSLLPY
jgi:LDH2 family malate/lactate/ureidoglycolate dehydrogenase